MQLVKARFGLHCGSSGVLYPSVQVTVPKRDIREQFMVTTWSEKSHSELDCPHTARMFRQWLCQRGQASPLPCSHSAKPRSSLRGDVGFPAPWGMETSGEGGSWGGGRWLGQGEDVHTSREASLSCDEHLGLGTGACREGEEGPEAARHVQMLLAGNIRPAAGERVPRGLTHGKDLHSGFGETVTSPPSSLLYRVGFCLQRTIKDTLSSLIALSTRVLPYPSLLHLQEPDPYPQTPGMVSAGAQGRCHGCRAILGDGCIPQGAVGRLHQ